MSVWKQIALWIFALTITGGNFVLAGILGMVIYMALEKNEKRGRDADDWGDY